MKIRDQVVNVGILEVRSIDWDTQKGSEVCNDRNFVVDGFLRLGIGIGNGRHVDSFRTIWVGIERVVVDVYCTFTPFCFPSICSLKTVSTASEKIKGWKKCGR